MKSPILFVTALVLLTSCNQTNYKLNLPTVSGEKLNQTGFQEIRSEILATNCLECHKWVNDYQVVKNRAPSISRSVLSGRMPKNRAFNLQQKALLLAWLEAGAPEFPGDNKPAPQPSPPVNGAELSFAEIHDALLVPYCLDCHIEANVDNNFIMLDSYAEVKLVLKDMHIQLLEKTMPPQKAEMQMPEQARQTLLEWIRADGPEFNKPKGDSR